MRRFTCLRWSQSNFVFVRNTLSTSGSPKISRNACDVAAIVHGMHWQRSISTTNKRADGIPAASVIFKDGHARYFSTLDKSHQTQKTQLQRITCSNIDVRFYAKGKSKKKDKSKGHGSSSKVMQLSQEELDSVMDTEKFNNQLNGQVEHLKNEFVQQLGLRTSVAAFDGLVIETSDGKFPLIQLGQVAQKSQQTIVINMTTSPQYISDVKTALMTSLGLNPQQDGTTLFVNLPKVTKEHRETLAKGAKAAAEKVKVKLRDVQNKHLHSLKKAKDHHSEDVVFSAQSYIQDEVKKYIEKVDALTVAKQKELLGGK